MKRLSTEKRAQITGMIVEGNSVRSITRMTGVFNFCRVHQTLRVTPAMEAGVTDHIWTLEELVGLLEAKTVAAAA